MDQISSQEINGILFEAKEQGRGFYNLQLIDSDTKESLSFVLPNSFFRKNNIGILDSVAKKKDGKIIEFFKKNNGQYKKCCDYFIEM